jgi:hypothetical protein
MKKYFFAMTSLFVAIAFISFSCNKDNNNPTQKTKTELLVQGTWKFKGATANGVDISNQNPPFSACVKDNILTFSANGSGNVNEGATKCNAGDPNDNPFTWAWMNNETMLHISTTLFSGGSNDFTLESISETELVVSQGYTPVAGPTYNIKISFQH